MRSGCTPQEAVDAVAASTPHRDWRQVAVLTADGTHAAYNGAGVTPHVAALPGDDCLAVGNMLVSDDVAPAMVAAFADADGPLARRLVAGLEAGERAGGETGTLRSAAVLVVHTESFPLVDLRIDDDPAPLEALDGSGRRTRPGPATSSRGRWIPTRRPGGRRPVTAPPRRSRPRPTPGNVSACSTSTGYAFTRVRSGSNHDRPVRMLNSHACHGQRTMSPGRPRSYSPGPVAAIAARTCPSHSGPPWCGQRLRSAKNSPSTLNTPIERPPISTILRPPGGISPTRATGVASHRRAGTAHGRCRA